MKRVRGSLRTEGSQRGQKAEMKRERIPGMGELPEKIPAVRRWRVLFKEQSGDQCHWITEEAEGRKG